MKLFEKQFNCNVQIATYNSADEAYAKLAAGSVRFDVVLGLSGSHIVLLQAKRLMAPLNHDYLANLKNIWPALQSPFYDRELATRSRTSSGRTGSAGATTRSRPTSRR